MFAYITEEGAYFQKRGGNFVIGRNNECVMEIPEEVLESLTLIDSVQVSSQAMVELLRTVNRYVEGKHSYRRTLAYQARQYAQALLAKNEEMYEPIALR